MSNNEKTYWLDDIEEHLVEGVIAVIFLLAFISAAVISAYFIDNKIVKDVIIGVGTLIGFTSLAYKTIKG